MFIPVPQRLPVHITEPVVRVLARLGVTPNLLTVLGCLGNVLAGGLLTQGWFVAGGLTMLVFSLFDGFDGALARATGRVSAFGSVFDATLDRVSEAAVLFGLVVYFSGRGDRTLTLVVVAALVGSFLVSYVRARVEIVGAKLVEGLFTRGVRVAFLSLALICSGLLGAVTVTVALWVLAGMANLTALHRLYLAWQRLGPTTTS